MMKPRTSQRWRATSVLSLGVLWVLYSGFAFSSPYVSRQLWDALQSDWLMNASLLLTGIAFWSWPPVLGCVWLGTPRLSRGVQCGWWTVAVLSQSGWVYLVL